MEAKLCFYICNSLVPEVSHLLQSGNYPDVTLRSFPAICSGGLMSNDRIMAMVADQIDHFSKIIIFVSACRGKAEINQPKNNKIEIIQLEQCFELFFSPPTIYHFIKQGNYLVSNGWLRNIDHHIREWGFDKQSAKSFFGESMKQILLLDTELPEDYRPNLEALSKYMGLPYEILPIGNSHLQKFIETIIFNFRNENERKKLNDRISHVTRESADYALIFYHLQKLIDKTEEVIIFNEIFMLIDLLFAPKQIIYQQIQGSNTSIHYFKSNDSAFNFNLKDSFEAEIKYGEEKIGVFVIIGIKFPEHIGKYQSMATTISQIGGLAISNARKYAELSNAKLRITESETRFKAIMKQSPSVIEMYDLKGFQRSVNHAYEELWGFPASHTVNQFNILKSVEVKRTGLFNDVMKAYNGDIVQVPEYIFNSTGKTEAKGEGRERWLSTRIYPLKDINGKVQNIIVTHEDVSDKKNAEKKIAETNQKFKNLSKSATKMLNLNSIEEIYEYITNSLHEQYPSSIILFNEVKIDEQQTILTTIKGLSLQLIDKIYKISGFKLENHKFKLEASHLELFKTGSFHHFKNGLSDFSGTEFPRLAAKSIEKLLGIHNIYTIGINKGNKIFAAIHFFNRSKNSITDNEYIESFVKQAGIIIERKLAEEQLRQSENELRKTVATKDKFFSIISHDLRSPFASIVSLLSLLAENSKDFSPAEFNQFAQSAHKTALSTFQLLENLLEWSRLQRGVLPFNPESIDLKEFVQTCDPSTFEMAKKKQITIKFDFPEGLIITADLNMLHSIMRNLVTNAIKFTHHGGKIQVKAERQPNHSALISIKDNGIGMDKERIENLFQIGTNVSRPGTDDETSSGLGLILCKEFVEKHSGKIWVESKERIGSTFYFSLPINQKLIKHGNI